MKKKNIKFVVLIEFVLFIVVFLYTITACVGLDDMIFHVKWFIDMPSISIIVLMTVPGLLIMGEWKDFIKAFSVGQKKYSLMELKNIAEAVTACQKMVLYSGVIELLVALVMLMGQLSSPETIGPNLAVCFLSCFYVALIEYLILPVKINVVRRMNEEMDMDYEDADYGCAEADGVNDDK